MPARWIPFTVNDVKVVNSVYHRARNIVVLAAGAEGFLRHRISGQGLAFILAGGTVVQKVLEVGEVLTIDVSCIAALTPSVDAQIKYNTPLRRAVFGGDNVVNGDSDGTRHCIHPKFTISSAFPAYCKVGDVTKHERKSKIERGRRESFAFLRHERKSKIDDTDSIVFYLALVLNFWIEWYVTP